MKSSASVATLERTPTSEVERVHETLHYSPDPEVRNRMVEEYLPLVSRLCRRFGHIGEPHEDLFQVGSIGLLKAIEKFDVTRGINFKSYAIPVVLGEIKNYLRDHGWALKVPRKLQTHRLAVARAVEALEQSLGRSPIASEIAEKAELSQDEVMDAFELGRCSNPVSLDAEYENDDEDGTTLIEQLGREDPLFHNLGDRMDLDDALNGLPEREKAIILLKFYADLPQTEVAKRLGISQMHVSRLQRLALGKLKLRLAGQAAY